MNVFALNTILAFGWAALVGQFTLASLLIGFGVSYFTLWVARPLFGDTTYFERVWRVLRLAVLFVYELVISSLRVVWDVITPSHLSRPGIIAMPLDAKGEGEILLVASLISLTPGSLSLDVSADRKTLYVHAMFVDDPEAVRQGLKQGMERRVIEAME
ncbi:MAG: Na+/H+ antiporter subunit E [Hyphomicrobiales bacterium]|nr:Na+/H+ antiporter subunit E [Hyphomicrobiales bacterium]